MLYFLHLRRVIVRSPVVLSDQILLLNLTRILKLLVWWKRLTCPYFSAQRANSCSKNKVPNKQKENLTKLKWDREKIEFHEATNSETSRENIRGAFFSFFLSFILEPSIESALKKFSDTVLHTAECLTRTICFKTGAERDTKQVVRL